MNRTKRAIRLSILAVLAGSGIWALAGSDLNAAKAHPQEPTIITVDGRVKSVDFGNHKITLAVPVLKDSVKQIEVRTFELTKDAPVFLDNRIRKDDAMQQGNLSDLTDETLVSLRLDADGAKVLKVTATGPDLGAFFKEVDADKKTITLTVKEDCQLRDNSYDLADRAPVLFNDGVQVERKLADLTAGTVIIAKLSVSRDKVLGIQVPGETLGVLWHTLDADNSKIIVLAKEGGKFVERSFRLTRNAKIEVSAVPGDPVMLHFSAIDKSKVIAVRPYE